MTPFNLISLCVAVLGFSICLARSLWVWERPDFIPDFIRHMPWITIRNRPNRWLTVVVYLVLAFLCAVAIVIRVKRLLGIDTGL
ncbi:hypothetical protein [Flavisolibacter nicotianae]|uniref:hypothetical protein n=1 Tax=Flavisolibacter nicotianae TaxID=2364882 RepID=UPI000EB09C88|nr:hypothetical protein [Flavisolibacter nicotianae]